MIPNDGGLFGRQKIPNWRNWWNLQNPREIDPEEISPKPKNAHSIHTAKIWLVNYSPCY
jgi:hypothetical protein